MLLGSTNTNLYSHADIGSQSVSTCNGVDLTGSVRNTIIQTSKLHITTRMQNPKFYTLLQSATAYGLTFSLYKIAMIKGSGKVT